MFEQAVLLEDTMGVSKLMDKRDIAAMKIAAIADRGTRRDFVDVYFLARSYSLDEMLEFYDQKYRKLEVNLYHIVRSLSFFDEAEREEEMPNLLKPVDWNEVKTFFVAEAKRLTKERIFTN